MNPLAPDGVLLLLTVITSFMFNAENVGESVVLRFWSKLYAYEALLLVNTTLFNGEPISNELIDGSSPFTSSNLGPHHSNNAAGSVE